MYPKTTTHTNPKPMHFQPNHGQVHILQPKEQILRYGF